MVDLLQIVRNIALLVMPFSVLIFAACFVIGVYMVMKGVWGASKSVEMGRYQRGADTPAPHLMRMLVGIFFITLPAFIVTLNATIFGVGIQSADQIFAYAPSTAGLLDPGSPARQIVIGITVIIQFLGVIAIIRGIGLLNKRASDQNVPLGPGLTFMIAGIAAVNFPVFMGAVERLIS